VFASTPVADDDAVMDGVVVEEEAQAYEEKL
jgi:hypothetical protein